MPSIDTPLRYTDIGTELLDSAARLIAIVQAARMDDYTALDKREERNAQD